MGYRLVTAPASLPVTVSEAKAHLRVDHSDEDALIEGLIRAAVSHLDGRTGVLGRCIVTQTWELILDAFPFDAIEIPLGPVASVTSISYVDVNGATQTVSAETYYVDTSSLSAWIVPDDFWPETMDTANAVTVRFVAGTAAADVPAALKQAILLLIGSWYENRAAVNVGNITTTLPFTVDALIAPFCRKWL